MMTLSTHNLLRRAEKIYREKADGRGQRAEEKKIFKLLKQVRSLYSKLLCLLPSALWTSAFMY
jgi:hypothetical protein